MSFTEIILKTPTVCFFLILSCGWIFSKLMITRYNTGDRCYCLQLLIRIFSSEYPQSFVDTEIIPLWGEETRLIIKHFVIFNFTFFTHLIHFSLRMTKSSLLLLHPSQAHFIDLFIIPSSHPHVLGATSTSTFPLLMLLLCARTSVNESRSTRTALLHAILPDLLEKTPPRRDLSLFTHFLEDDQKLC